MQQKVLAYVVRREACRLQLLVFEHADAPEAGLQVPAGTVEQGETPEAALWRELDEESGLRPPKVGVIGKLVQAPAPDRSLTRHIYLLVAAAGLPGEWRWTVTGRGEDEGMAFDFRWQDVAPGLRLAGDQARWLGLIPQALQVDSARS